MAEGHSVVRWARWISPLIGEPLESVDAPVRWRDRAAAVVGQPIESIETHGKHLLIEVSGGTTIHCHGLMFGAWEVGKPGFKSRKPRKNVRLRLLTESHEALFFNGPIVEFLTASERRRHPRLKSLGPDVMKPDFDRDEAWRRLETSGDRPLGDAILDQTLMAGIGNIFKSEGLFLAGLDPRRKTSSVSREDVERLWDALIPLMLDAAEGAGPIVTLPRSLRRGRERNWVYWRGGRPCFRCETRIDSTRQGVHARVTFFCPACQR